MSLKDRIKIKEQCFLSTNHFKLERYDFEYLRNDGIWQTQMREVYDCGDGAAILLYNLQKQSVILIRQLRLPAVLNGHDELMLEVPAGLLEGEDAKIRMIKEVEEETGYHIKDARFICNAFVSPGAIKQKMHLFVAQYEDSDKKSKGGGHFDEGEEIEIIEMDFSQAYKMIETNQMQDAKAIILLLWAKINLFKD
jgi:nudix-type nucleoside diphosphatase (YffH/AdpP family)